MKWLKRLAIGFGVVVVLVLLWGVAIEPRLYQVTREPAPIPELPERWEGREIAVIADFQVGMWWANVGTIRRIVRELVEDPPAAVLIAGDFVYKADDRPDELARTAVDLVRPLVEAGIPTYAVLGNHDYSLDLEDDPRNDRVAAAVRRAANDAGIRLLSNEAVALEPRGGGEPLYIVGIDSNWAHEDASAAAVAQVPEGAPRFVFMHNPQSFRDLPAGTAPIAVAGHTHGGQINIPFTPGWNWLKIPHDDEYVAVGWDRDGDFGQPGNRLYVNRGIGFSDVPVRINTRPEVTRFVLESGGPLPTIEN